VRINISKLKKNQTNPNFEKEEESKCNARIKEIMNKKKQLTNDELVFIFDFLLEMCKNA